MPTPLYAVYQAAWGFSPITVTVVFAIYALAVLATLLVVGSLSDYVGRRPVLIAATLLQAVTMVVFATPAASAGCSPPASSRASRPVRRRRRLSILYVISYLAMGLPAVIGGFRVVHGGGVFTTAREYSIAVMALAALALVGTLVRRPSAGLAAPTLALSRRCASRGNRSAVGTMTAVSPGAGGSRSANWLASISALKKWPCRVARRRAINAGGG